MSLSKYDPIKETTEMTPTKPNAVAFEQSILNLLQLSNRVDFVNQNISVCL